MEWECDVPHSITRIRMTHNTHDGGTLSSEWYMEAPQSQMHAMQSTAHSAAAAGRSMGPRGCCSKAPQCAHQKLLHCLHAFMPSSSYGGSAKKTETINVHLWSDTRFNLLIYMSHTYVQRDKCILLAHTQCNIQRHHCTLAVSGIQR